LRDVINGMGKFGYSPSPAFDAFDYLTKVGKAGIGFAMGEKDEIEKSDVKNAALALGYFAHLPSRQAFQTIEYLYDYWTGDVEPNNPFDFAWNAGVTRKRD